MELLEDSDPKLKALGIIESGGEMAYVADGEEAKISVNRVIQLF